MSDDTTKRGPQDAARVNIHEDHEVRYWTTKFGVSREQLEAAVAEVGPMSRAVEIQLRKTERHGG